MISYLYYNLDVDDNNNAYDDYDDEKIFIMMMLMTVYNYTMYVGYR